MPTINITGTLQNASGQGAEGLVVSLRPEAPEAGAEEAIGGVGVVLSPVQILTSPTGTFQIPVLSGFRYRLDIDAIGYSRVFRAPATDVAFHLLGLAPEIETAVDFETCEDPSTPTIRLTVKAPLISTVRERFQAIEVLRSSAQDGVYVVDTTIDLVAGQTFYPYLAPAPIGDWFRVRYTDRGAPAELSDESEAVQGQAPEEDLVFSVDELKEQYLFGVNLDGYPDRLFRNYIASAVAWLEKELEIPIVAREIVNELHDHYARDYGRWGFFKLREWPILVPSNVDAGQPFDPVTNPSPVKVSFQYPSQFNRVDINENWIVLPENGETGHLQLVPGQGGIADVLLIPGALLPLWSGSSGRVPGIWRFTYRAGFCPGELPADIKDAIGMKAAIQVFNIAGDLIAGAGIANTSISVPGLSQSIGTTSSATNSGYGARIGQYEKQLKDLIPGLKRYYGKSSKITVV